MAYYTAGIIGSYIRGAATGSGFDISGSTVSAGTVVASTRIRDTSGNLDISGGNITVSGVITAGAISSSGISPTNIVVPGYIRNAITPTTLDISGGNISNSGTIVAGTITTLNALTSNRIGGVNLDNSNVTNSGATQSGRFTTISASSSNEIGGVVLSNSDLSMSSTGRILAPIVRNALVPTQFDISGGNISNSGRITTGPGTAAAPSYTFANDAAVGLYDPASNVLGMVTSGVEQMRIDPSGNVGIGTTTNPLSNYRLTLRGLGGTHAGIAFGRSTNAIPFVGMVYDETAETIGFRVNTGTTDLNCNAMVVARATGRVGIGTTAPTVVLDICGSSAFITTQIRNNAGQAGLQITGSGFADNSGIQIWHNSTEQAVYNNNLNPFSIWTNNARRMTFLSNGNVGIGTTNPTALLTVAGDISQSSTTLFNYGDGNKIFLTNFGSVGPRISHSAGWTTNFFAGSNASTTGNFTFNHGLTGGTTAESMRITSDRRIGIGTPAPEYLFDMVGTGGTGVMFVRNSSDQASINVVGNGLSVACNIGLYHKTTDQGLYHANTNPFHIWTGGVQRMTILSDGRVGINTADPTARLTVAGDISASGTTRSSNFIGTSAASNSIGGITLSNQFLGVGVSAPSVQLDVSGIVRVRNPGGGEANITMISGAGVDATGFRMYQVSSEQGIYTSNTSPFYVYTSGLRRLIILSNGNVGIGTTDPQTRLHVVAASNDVSYGALTIGNSATFNVGQGLNFGTSLAFMSTYKNTGIGGQFVQGKIDVLKESASDTPDSYMAFSTRYEIGQVGNPGILSERMRLTALGRVGIGTTAPAYTLDVSGTIGASSNEYTVYVTASTTLSVPTGFTMAHITLVGAGGGGGATLTGGVAAAGAGGGGAGWIVEQLFPTIGGASFTITLGTGGSPGLSGGTAPTPGGDSTLTAGGTVVFRATGGSAGTNSTGVNGAPGGAGYFGGGGGGGANSASGGAGGVGTIQSGTNGANGNAGSGGAGGRGGGATNGGNPSTANGGGGGGGGPGGGVGGVAGSPGVFGGAGLPGCGGGGAGGLGSTLTFGGAGGNGYAIVRFLR